MREELHMAAKKKKVTKTAFVLGLPKDLPAKEVVAKAKASGISISDKGVYAIRSEAKKRSRKTARKSATATPKRSTNGTRLAASNKAEDILKAVASQLGLEHALGILQAEHDRVRRLLGG